MPIDITTIIIMIGVGIVISIVLKLLGKFFKWIFYIWLILLVVSAVLGIMVFRDVSDLKENLQKKLILLESEEKLITGFYLEDFEELFGQQGVDPLEIMKTLQIPDLDLLNKFYLEKDYDSMIGDSNKMFIVKEDMFSSIGVIEFGDKDFSYDELVLAIKSDDPRIDIAKKLYEENDEYVIDYSIMVEQSQDFFGSKDTFRNVLFISLFSKAQENNGETFLIEEFKKGNIIIYKETITFKLLKRFPLGLITDRFSGINATIE